MISNRGYRPVAMFRIANKMRKYKTMLKRYKKVSNMIKKTGMFP